MGCLVSFMEVKQELELLNIERYYLEIDMNGALSIILPTEYEDYIEKVEGIICGIDKNRVEFNSEYMYYPLKRIEVDENEDEETSILFKNKKVIKSTYTQKLNTWAKGSKKPNKNKKRAKRVAFYSYKGGVGRTTALAIVARLLAKEGFKVAVIDLDLEAPGLNSLLLTSFKTSQFGVVDYLYHAPWSRDSIDERRFVSQYIVREEVKRRNEEPGQLIIMSAGGTRVEHENNYVKISLLFDKLNTKNTKVVLDPHYLQKLSYIDFDIYARQSNSVFEQLLEDVEAYTQADIILLDARTGFSDVSGSLLNEISDVISIHIQDNLQNREGVKFICDHIDAQKLKDKTIWSYTKVPKDYSREMDDLKSFIASCIKSKGDKLDDECSINFHELKYNTDLEDVDANQLQEYIDHDSVPKGYKELFRQIQIITGLDDKRSVLLSNDERAKILRDFKDLMLDNNPPTYISQRFLNEDLKLFVGFPGSGKRTFKKYIDDKGDYNVKVISFEEYTKMEINTHSILANVTFLDWNYQEATQAICKWLLNSNEFFYWLTNNKIMEKVTIKDLTEMRSMDNAKYELSEQIAEEILNFVFDKSRPFRGWKTIFNSLQYRRGYVLPKDVITGVKLYIEYFIKKFMNNNKRHTGNSIFPIIQSPAMLKRIWVEIGIDKKQWIKNYDEKLLNLIFALNKSSKRTIEDVKETYLQGNGGSDSDFKKLFDKALAIDIIANRPSVFGFNSLILTPIYSLIKTEEVL